MVGSPRSAGPGEARPDAIAIKGDDPVRRATAGVLLLASVLALLAAGCGSDAAQRRRAAAEARARAHAALVARQAAAGRGVFARNCASCHTIEGHVAHPTFVESMIPNLDEVRPRPEYVIQRIDNGGFDMPSLSSELKPEQIADVVAYVTTIGGSRVQPPSAEQASAIAQGQQVFDANCARCHSIAGRPATNRPPAGYPGTDFNDVKPSAAMVVRQVNRGIRGEMPSFRRRLSAAEIEAVAAYVTATAGR